MKTLKLIIIFIAFLTSATAQTDSTFYFLDKSTLTNNVLCAFNDTTYWGMYDGLHDRTCNNLFSLQILSDLTRYTFGENEKPSTESIKANAANEIKQNHRIPLLMLFYEYTRIKTNAIPDSLIIYENGKLYDVLPRAEAPYETDIVAVAAPLKEKIYHGANSFYISRSFFISNLSDPSQIEVDFDDGAGFRTVTFGQVVSVTYANDDVKNIVTRFTYNTTEYTAKAQSAAEYCHGNYPAVDEFLGVQSNIAFWNPSPYPIQWQNYQMFDPNYTGVTGATVYIKFGANHPSGNLVKPLIFIEGIDFGYDFYSFMDLQGNVIRNGDVGWCEFWGDSYSTGTNSDLNGYKEFEHSPAFLNAMLAEGYDIMFVDFIDGADFIQRNAMIIVELLNTIKSRQATGGYAHQPSVIIGASMGGQVAKYALRYMEDNGIKHCTRNYISFDSPQRGANIPLCLQEWIDFFAFKGQGNDAGKEQLMQTLNRPATRQLLVRHYDDGHAYYQQDRIDFQNTMDALGYPQKLRKVAISSGSKIGLTQQYLSSGQQILDTEWKPSACLYQTYIMGDCFSTGTTALFNGKAFKSGALPCLLLTSVPCSICAQQANLFDNATIMQPIGTPGWDNAPGGNRNTAKFIAKTFNDEIANYAGLIGGNADANPLSMPAVPRESFIPVISALDVNTTNLTVDISAFITYDDRPSPQYPFDAYYASATNQPHVQLEDMNLGVNSNLVWSMNEILNSEPPLPPVLNSFSLNGGVFNMSRLQNSIITSCEVGSGGKLYVNADLPADFGQAGLPYPVANSTLEAQTCDCDNVTVEIKDGGEFILGDDNPNNKAIVKFHTGSTLILRTGSTLIINDYSSLLLEEGTNFICEPDVTIKLIGAHSLLDIKDDWVEIDITSGTQLIVSNGGGSSKGGTLNLKAGNIDIYTNGSLRNTNCTINLLGGTYFHFHDDAHIELDYEDACLHFGGHLTLKVNSDFEMEHPNSTIGGYIKFSNPGWPDHYITTENNCTFTLEGNDKTDKIAEIEGNYTWVNLNDNLIKLTLTGGQIVFSGYSNSWSVCPDDYEITNIEAVASYVDESLGFLVGGKPNHKIEDVRFRNFKKALRHYPWWGGNNNPLYLKDCEFIQCWDAFQSNGSGIHFNDVTFTDCIYPMSCDGMVLPSTLQNIHINSSADLDAIKFNAAGNSSLLVKNSFMSGDNINTYISNIGVNYSGGNHLALRCNTIYAMEWGAKVHQGGSLYLGTLNGGGYNNLRSNGGVINVDNVTQLDLENGFNDLSSDNSFTQPNTGYTLYGTLNNPPNPIIAHQNKWFVNNLNPPLKNPPSTIGYNLRKHGTMGFQSVNLLDLTPAVAICPVIPDPSVYDRLSPLGDCRECPTLYTEHFDGVKLNEAVQAAIDTATQGDSIKDDIAAIEMLVEILSASLRYDNPNINWLTSLAYTKIKEALGNAIQYGRITEVNSGGEHVNPIINITNELITRSRERDDDNSEFYYSLDLATTYRLVNEREEAIRILLSIPSCLRLSEDQTTYLYEWIARINAEQMLITGDLDVMQFDNFVGGEGRVFEHFANTQANIDTLITSTTSQTAPTAANSVSLSDGSIYAITSVTDTSTNYHITKTSAGSTFEWEQVFDGKQNGTDSAKSIAMDANNFIYVTGKSWNGLDYDIATVKYDTAGNQYWTAIYNDLDIGDDEPISIIVDTSFLVHVYARSYNDSVLVYKTIVYSQCDTTCVERYGKQEEKKEAEFSIKVFPVPTSDKLNVQVLHSSPSEKYNLTLYDITGRVVARENIPQRYLLDVNALPAGVYQLVISNSKSGVKKQRVVIE